MSLRNKFREGIDWFGTLWTICGWFGLTSLIGGGVVTIGGAAWAAVTGVSRPIVIMAAFCTITATITMRCVRP
jgi:hypothetical protein